MNDPPTPATPRRSESPSGYHFWTTYQRCPRSFYIRYILGLVKSETPRALIRGGAMAEALEVACLTRDIDEAAGKFLDEINSRRDEYSDPGDFAADTEYGPAMLAVWWDALGAEMFSTYEDVRAEVPLEVPLPGGFIATLRLDRLITHPKSNALFIIETKTTSADKLQMMRRVEEQDQATTYLLGAKLLGMNVTGVIPEVLYHRARKSSPDAFEAVWGSVVMRSTAELADHYDGVVSLLSEIAQKTHAWQTGAAAPSVLFPRSCEGCGWMGSCAHPEICRNLPAPGVVPMGYRKDDSKGIDMKEKEPSPEGAPSPS